MANKKVIRIVAAILAFMMVFGVIAIAVQVLAQEAVAVQTGDSGNTKLIIVLFAVAAVVVIVMTVVGIVLKKRKK